MKQTGRKRAGSGRGIVGIIIVMLLLCSAAICFLIIQHNQADKRDKTKSEGEAGREQGAEDEQLETAVSGAILDYHKNTEAKVDFSCESHVTLEVLPGVRTDTKTGDEIETAEVYAMISQESVRYEGDSFQMVSGSLSPGVLTFDVNENGVYQLTDYWIPLDGTDYEPSIRERFEKLSKEKVEDALDVQKYAEKLQEECNKKVMDNQQVLQ